MNDPRWASYYEATKSKPPSKLLVRAMKYVKAGGKALELGAGALVDSQYLLAHGLDITAVDSSPASAELARGMQNERFHFVQCTYDSFEFTPEQYDLISAQWALPFNPPATFDAIFSRLKDSLAPNGIFVGQLFGDRDEWNRPEKDMTFHTREHVNDLLARMHVIHIHEEEKDMPTAMGVMKHWHVFHIIAQRD